MHPSFDKTTVHSMLADLKRSDRRFKNFGTQVHRYELNAPLPQSDIDAFERKYNVRLPDDYRAFITEIGNGGAGPYYGLFPFGQQDDLRGFCTWEKGGLVGDFSAEFPHEYEWNLPESFWGKMPDPAPDVSEEQEDRMMETWNKELEEHYWNPKIMNGAIPICHEGCAHRQWLVINGKQKGFIWSDSRASDEGIVPIRDDAGNQVTFAEWYMTWLRKPLRV